MSYQLATDISKTKFTLEDLLTDEHYALEPKYDGVRIIAEVRDGKVVVFNRDAEHSSKVHPDELEYLKLLPPGLWVFDGEWVDKRYMIFDILEWPQGPLFSLSWDDRTDLLHELFNKIPWDSSNISRVVACVDSLHKAEILKAVEQNQGEGVIFKRRDAKYEFKRSSNFIKYKFFKDIDCVVIDKGVEGRANYELGLWDRDTLRSVGRVSALGGDKDRAEIGDVVQVRCLYAVSDRLVQPTMPRVRTDKKPHECTWDQLEAIITNKNV